MLTNSLDKISESFSDRGSMSKWQKFAESKLFTNLSINPTSVST